MTTLITHRDVWSFSVTKTLTVLSADFEKYPKCYFFMQMLTPVHNDADDIDNVAYTNDADNYNRVIDIAQLRVFSCAENYHMSN